MEIGIDASRYQHAQPTGVEVYSDHVISGLIERAQSQRQHQVRLYTPKLLQGIPPSKQTLIPAKRLWTLRGLTRQMRQAPPDVLFVPSHVLPLTQPQRAVITIHDVAFREFPSAYSLAQYAYLHWSTRYAVKNASKIVVPSRGTHDDLIRYYHCPPDKIELIPHGFEPPPKAPAAAKQNALLKRFGLSPDTPYFFFIGRLETKKNLARLVQAFARFRHQHPDWRLVLGGGRGVGFRAILKALEKEQMLDCVVMPGYLDEMEKATLFHHARGFVFPSLSEGFGFPILEAASYKLPILAADIPALRDFSDMVTTYVDPRSIEGIAAGLETLTKAKPTAHANALKNYSWDHTVEAVWNLLTSD